MRFKTKDLLVSISPHLEVDAELAKNHCIWGTRICIRPTLHPCGWSIGNCWHCTFLPTICVCTWKPTIDPDPCRVRTVVGCLPTVFELEDPSDLVTLRKELSEVIEQLDRLEKEGLPSQLRTAAEAEQAEAALEGALEEIRRQKKHLK